MKFDEFEWTNCEGFPPGNTEFGVWEVGESSSLLELPSWESCFSGAIDVW